MEIPLLVHDVLERVFAEATVAVDTTSLKALALVNSAFCQLAQRHLFRRVAFDCTDGRPSSVYGRRTTLPSRILPSLLSNPRLGSYVRVVEITTQDETATSRGGSSTDSYLDKVLGYFTKLESFRFRLTWAASDWRQTPIANQQAIEAALRLPTLKHVQLGNLTNFPLSMVLLLTSLDTVFLIGVIPPAEEPVVFPTVERNKPFRTQTLDLRQVHSAVVDVFTRASHSCQSRALTHLHVNLGSTLENGTRFQEAVARLIKEVRSSVTFFEWMRLEPYRIPVKPIDLAQFQNLAQLSFVVCLLVVHAPGWLTEVITLLNQAAARSNQIRRVTFGCRNVLSYIVTMLKRATFCDAWDSVQEILCQTAFEALEEVHFMVPRGSMQEQGSDALRLYFDEGFGTLRAKGVHVFATLTLTEQQ